MSKAFYSVANGRTPGVFLTWAECEKSVKDFPGAKFKKFTSEKEANDFCKNSNSVKPILNQTNKSKYSNITFESESESDSEPKPKVKVKSISSKPVTNNFVNTRAEEEEIRANINFDTSESDDSDLESNLKLKETNKESNYSTELGDFKPDIIVYTDGACISNGRSNAKAGIGVYFSPEDPRNISIPVQGKQSNNTAELGALILAYKAVQSDINLGKKVAFFTDSVYSLWCLTTYGDKCAQTKWTKSIPNREIVKEAYELFGSNKSKCIKLIHIKSHTGKQDIHSLGNEQADRLANLAIGVDVEEKQSNSSKQFVKVGPITEKKKIYLKVSFDKKEQAKKLGCRWDPEKKSWYCDETNEKALEQFGGKI
jgi:ribonuclease HI